MPIYLPPLTRRRFLAGSLAAGAGTLLDRSLCASEPTTDPNRWVLLADIHIWEQRDGAHRGAKPAVNFNAAVREITALDPRPAAVIVAGDCVYLNGHAADYSVLADLIKPIRAAGIPLHFALGNHDHRENFWAAFPETRPKRPAVADKYVSIIETARANWFLLDSLDKTRSTPGLLGKPQLAWLGKALETRAEKPALVLAHHYLSAPGGLHDSAELLKVVAEHKQVKAYFFGHSHAWSVTRKDDLQLVNLPATAWLFDPSQPRGWVDMTLRDGGASLVLNALDKKHPKHAQRTDLNWRPR
jgi:3',5'-cyclic-AMP phosphodiesterase